MSRRDYISDHAVVRWIERYDRIDLSALRQAFAAQCGFAATDGELLAAYAAQSGISAHMIRRRMMTDTLRTALATGACGVRVGAVRLVIISGVVVTVRFNFWDRKPAPSKTPGRARERRSGVADELTLQTGG